MRFFNNRFPYTSANNINLDWIIKRVKALGNTVEGYSSDIETALTTAQTAQTTAESVSGIAQAAQTAAADALETAESASETAEGIAATAQAAQTTAQAAQTTAQAAQTAAQAAQTTAQAAQTAVAGKQGAPATTGTAGQVLGLDSNLSPVWVNQSGGGGGTSDYADLTNKPSINNVTLSGNKTGADLGLASATDLSTVSTTAQAAQTAAQAAQTTANDAADDAADAMTAAQAAQTTANDAADDAADAMTAAQAAQTTANGKQDAITATGVLYRTSAGVIRSATLGTEYGSKTLILALTAAGWSNGSQTVNNEYIFDVASYGYEVSPSPASLPAYASAGVYASAFASGGGLVFSYTGTTAPATDLTVYVRRFVTS